MKCEKKWIVSLFTLCCVAFFSSPVIAYVNESPCAETAGSNLEASVVINSSKIDYTSKDDDFDLERKIMGVSLSKGIGKKADIYGTLGYLFDGSVGLEGLDDLDLDGGYFLSAGVRYMIFQSGEVSGHLFGQFDYVLEEKYKLSINHSDLTMKFDGYEISLGGALKYQIDKNISAFAGLSFFPVADLSYKAELRIGRNTLDDDGDIERDDNFGFKLGARYNFNNQWNIRGEADFGSDQAYIVSIGSKF